MSTENLELVRRWFDALERGDVPLELCHPEIVIRNWDEAPVRGPYHGHAGLGQWWSDLADAFEEVNLELKEVIDLGADRVLTIQHIVGVFRSTGIPLDAPWGSILTFRDGLIASATGYVSPGRARKAAGLAPGEATS